MYVIVGRLMQGFPNVASPPALPFCVFFHIPSSTLDHAEAFPPKSATGLGPCRVLARERMRPSLGFMRVIVLLAPSCPVNLGDAELAGLKSHLRQGSRPSETLAICGPPPAPRAVVTSDVAQRHPLRFPFPYPSLGAGPTRICLRRGLVGIQVCAIARGRTGGCKPGSTARVARSQSRSEENAPRRCRSPRSSGSSPRVLDSSSLPQLCFAAAACRSR